MILPPMFNMRLYWVLPSLLCAFILSIFAAIIPISTVHAQDAYSSLSPTSQAIVDAINQARASAGRQPLQVNALLNLAAQSHANDVNAYRIFGHTGSDGSNVRFRVRRTGYNSDWVGENWILTSTPGEAMGWWLSDPPHAENIFHANYTEIGVGEIRDPGTGLIFWVTDFARSAGGSAAVVQSAAPSAAVEVASVEVATVEPVVQSVPPGGLDYTVQAGDTLLVIGLRHGLDWETIADANGLTGRSMLNIGQVLHIPGGGAVGGLVAGDSAVDYAAKYNATYSIKAGDTLAGIAERFGVSWQELAAINSFGEWTVLQIDQTIKVPGGDTVAAAAVETVDVGQFFVPANNDSSAADNAVYYTLEEGDTIFSIAMRKRLDWTEILRLNGLDENSILQPGQKIRLK